MGRRFVPEPPLEPPENYEMDPPYCEECEEDECLLDYGKVCEAQEKWMDQEKARYQAEKEEREIQEAMMKDPEYQKEMETQLLQSLVCYTKEEEVEHDKHLKDLELGEHNAKC